MNAAVDEAQTLPLEERIRRAEQRLIAREDALRVRVTLLGERLSAATRPARLVWPGLGVAGGLAALLMVWRRNRRRAEPLEGRRRTPPERISRRHRREVHDLPWVRLVAFAWPMLPERWRSKISPGLATALATFGVPLFERFMARRAAAADRRAERQARLDRSGPASG